MEASIAVIFGVVQGLTEFIPVSSSGHLLLVHALFPNFLGKSNFSFDVALHIGTLLALVIAFRADIMRFCRVLITPRSVPDSTAGDRRLMILIVIAMIPAGVVGFFLDDFIEATIHTPLVVAAMLIVVSLLFFLVERYYARVQHGELSQLRPRQALWIGLAQVLALIPGTSRSGITMVAAMFTRLSREDAARFSFLVSLPLIAAAAGKKTVDLLSVGILADEWWVFLVGIVTSGVVGFAAIRVLLRYLRTNTLIPFALYRIGLAAVVLIVYFI